MSQEPTTSLPTPSVLVAPESLDAIYERHFDFVWQTLRGMGVDMAHIDDAVQDVFVVVHRRLRDFEGRSSMKTWLFGIARRVAKERRRTTTRDDRLTTVPEGLEDVQPGPLELAERAQSVAVLQRLLDTLDDNKREVLVLAELLEHSVPEVAELLELNVHTTYTRLRAARLAFNKALIRHRASLK